MSAEHPNARRTEAGETEVDHPVAAEMAKVAQQHWDLFVGAGHVKQGVYRFGRELAQ